MTEQYRCPKCHRLLFKLEIKKELFKEPELNIIYKVKGLPENMNNKTGYLEVICPKCNTVSAVANRKLIEVGEAVKCKS